jgi:SAM-dependent methyltransferase
VTSIHELLAEAEAHPVVGWDFSWLGERVVSRPPPWDYEAIVERHAERASDLLDLGTGGGHWLESLGNRPARTVATESWPPNLAIARGRLGRLGVEVVGAAAVPDNLDQPLGLDSPPLPFADASFSLVVSRHESYLAAEIARVLRPGGVFVTQQMGGDYNPYRAALGLPPVEPRVFELQLAREQLRAAGLRVLAGESGSATTTFADAGAFAYWLRAIPWIVEGFSVSAQRAALEALQRRLDDEGPLTIEEPAFVLEAAKPR